MRPYNPEGNASVLCNESGGNFQIRLIRRIGRIPGNANLLIGNNRSRRYANQEIGVPRVLQILCVGRPPEVMKISNPMLKHSQPFKPYPECEVTGTSRKSEISFCEYPLM